MTGTKLTKSKTLTESKGSIGGYCAILSGIALATTLMLPALGAGAKPLPIEKIGLDKAKQFVIVFGNVPGQFPAVPSVLNLEGPNHRVVVEFTDATIDKASMPTSDQLGSAINKVLPAIKSLRYYNITNALKPTARIVFDLPEKIKVDPRVVKLEENSVTISFGEEVQNPAATAKALAAGAATAPVPSDGTNSEAVGSAAPAQTAPSAVAETRASSPAAAAEPAATATEPTAAAPAASEPMATAPAPAEPMATAPVPAEPMATAPEPTATSRQAATSTESTPATADAANNADLLRGPQPSEPAPVTKTETVATATETPPTDTPPTDTTATSPLTTSHVVNVPSTGVTNLPTIAATDPATTEATAPVPSVTPVPAAETTSVSPAPTEAIPAGGSTPALHHNWDWSDAQLKKSETAPEPGATREVLQPTSAQVDAAVKASNGGAPLPESALPSATKSSTTTTIVDTQKSAVTMYNAAVRSHLSGKLADAINDYKAALAINPALEEAHSNLGLIYNQQHIYDAALNEFHKALAINPKDAISYNGIGAALRAQKDLPGAIRNWQTAIDLDPKLATAHYNLGTAFEIQKEYDKALESYKDAVRNDFHLGDAYYRMGLIMQRQNRLTDAEAQFKEALKVSADSEYSDDARKRLASLKTRKTE